MVSLVLLLREHQDMDVATLEGSLDTLFPGHFLPKNEGSFVTNGAHAAEFLVKSTVLRHSGMFLVNAIPGPYGEGLPGHSAWTSVDRVAAIGSDDDAYRFIGKTLAKVGGRAVAVVHPATGKSVPFDDATPQRLRSEDVLQSLGISTG
jgi:hypothetical protein